jgi:hypothetical protein
LNFNLIVHFADVFDGNFEADGNCVYSVFWLAWRFEKKNVFLKKNFFFQKKLLKKNFVGIIFPLYFAGALLGQGFVFVFVFVLLLCFQCCVLNLLKQTKYKNRMGHCDANSSHRRMHCFYGINICVFCNLKYW